MTTTPTNLNLGNGGNCQFCGQWIEQGKGHSCFSLVSQATPIPVNQIFWQQPLDDLKAIRALLEQLLKRTPDPTGIL